jgi:serine phosphatase RsbU (regulator of sigma subunit)
MQKIGLYLCLFGLVILGLSACKPMSYFTPKAQKGKLDLHQWNFDMNLQLDGEWEFYWQKLLAPDNFVDSNALDPVQFVHVPLSWTALKDSQKQQYPAYGYATYRLQIKLPSKYPKLGIYIPKVWSATKVWVNKELVYTVGKINNQYQGYENQILEKIIELDGLKTNQLEIIVQVANFDMFIAGIVQSFEIEGFTKLTERTSLIYTRTLMWLGALLVMSGYHFVLFYFRRKNLSVLYFGIICLLLAIRLVIFGEHYLYEYLKEHTDWFSFSVQSKVYYIITTGMVPLALIYVKSLYPNKINPLIIRICLIISALYAIFLLLTSPHIFILTITYFELLAALFIIYLLVELIRAYWQKQEDSLWQMIGMLVMAIAGINDSLQAEGINIFDAFELFPSAFGALLLIQFAILARRFARAFREVEDLSENLEKKVAERTQELSQKNLEIEQKNLEIEEAYQEIKDSVIYASRIQKAILADINELNDCFAEAFIFFQPRDIVSGDFYWFANLDNPLFTQKAKILIVADCTGHGVPGALMTVMGNDFLNEIILKEQIIAPRQILYELDKRISQALNKQGASTQQYDGMDIAIVLLDETKKSLIYAGAKSTLYLVRNGQIEEIKPSSFSIGIDPFKRQKVFESQTLHLEEGTMIYLSSDGFQDQYNYLINKKYLRKRFREFLLQISPLPIAEQKHALSTEFITWKANTSQTDDVLVVGLKI